MLVIIIMKFISLWWSVSLIISLVQKDFVQVFAHIRAFESVRAKTDDYSNHLKQFQSQLSTRAVSNGYAWTVRILFFPWTTLNIFSETKINEYGQILFIWKPKNQWAYILFTLKPKTRIMDKISNGIGKKTIYLKPKNQWLWKNTI